MALKQGFIFKVAENQESITSVIGMWERVGIPLARLDFPKIQLPATY